MNPRYILLINGAGGHRYEMQRLLSHIKSKLVAKGISAVHFGECIVDDLIVDSYPVSDIRHKSSKVKTIIMALSSFTHRLINSFKIGWASNLSTILSTGLGLCIFLAVLMNYFFCCNVIYIEMACMLYHRA